MPLKNRKAVYTKVYTKSAAALLMTPLLWLVGCENSGNQPVDSTVSNTTSPDSTATPADSSTDAAPQKELVKPAAGKGNVQGKVLFNDKPAVNIEVTLSEKFSTILGASGKDYTARTDKNGDYVIKNVPPKEYEGLTARVFDTNSVVFMQSGILKAKSYEVKAGETLFIDPTHLFKSDIKLLFPKSGSTIKDKKPVFKWQTYPDAAYYKFTLSSTPYISGLPFDIRADGTSYELDKPLDKATYRVRLQAYNSNDRKLAETDDSLEFKVAP